MTRSSSTSAEAGFTLIELLVVMVLLGMITVALFGGIRFGARSWESGHERLEQLNEVEVAQSVLRRLLGTAREVTLFDANRDRDAVSFTGRRDAVYFAAPLPAHRGIGGAYAFALRVVRDGDGDHLALAWRLQRPETPPAEAGEYEDETLLLENISAIAFDYYGATDDDRSPGWQDDWVAIEGLPRLVRVTVGFPAGDGRTWPPLTIAPALAASVAEPAR